MTVGRKTSVRRLMEGQPSATSNGEEGKEKYKEHKQEKNMEVKGHVLAKTDSKVPGSSAGGEGNTIQYK